MNPSTKPTVSVGLSFAMTFEGNSLTNAKRGIFVSIVLFHLVFVFTMILTHYFSTELIDDKKNTSNFFGKDFDDALMKGRNELPVHYMNMFYFLWRFFFF